MYDSVDISAPISSLYTSVTPAKTLSMLLAFVDLLDMTSPEAAEALGVRPSTVRVLTSRARASLKEGMES